MKPKLVYLLFFSLLAWSCGDGTLHATLDAQDGISDGKPTDQDQENQNAESLAVENQDKKATNPDESNEEGIQIEISSEISLCGVFQDGREIQNELDLLCEIGLKTMTQTLPQDSGSFEFDLIEKLTFGPEKEKATKLGPGVCFHEIQEISGYLTHKYQCEQSFEVGQDPLVIYYPLEITFLPDQPRTKKLVFDEKYLSFPLMEGFLGAGQDYNTEMIQFASCKYAALELYRIVLEWENHDQLILDQRGADPRGADIPLNVLLDIGYPGATAPANLVKAEVRLNGSQFQVNDYFQLVYASWHHNWFEQYLIVLDSPLDGIYGLYCQDAGENGREPPQELLYLGKDLDPQNPIRRVKLSNYKIDLIESP